LLDSIRSAINNAAGTISSTSGTLLGTLGGVSASGALANVAFHSTGQGVSPVGLFNVQLLDSTLSPIVFTTIDGQISQVTPEPGSFALLFFGLSAFTLAFRRY
jgi:PEP-CTERM motif-containing protein